MTGRLIIASNRIAKPGAPRAGGLAVAIEEALAARGGVWFGWSGETVERETRGVRLFAEENVDFALADLTQSEYEGYYLGYANRTLWPVFHYRVDLAHFDDADFAAYEQVNRRFARLLAQFTREDDTIWVHDYHLIPLAAELRRHLRDIQWSSRTVAPPRTVTVYDHHGVPTRIDGSRFFSSTFWDPAQYQAWQDAQWRAPPEGSVKVGEVEQAGPPEGE